jgi:hypothetical protein
MIQGLFFTLLSVIVAATMFASPFFTVPSLECQHSLCDTKFIF